MQLIGRGRRGGCTASELPGLGGEDAVVLVQESAPEGLQMQEARVMSCFVALRVLHEKHEKHEKDQKVVEKPEAAK